MYKQFIDRASGLDVYLITSLMIFFVFFLLVGLLLVKMKKTHINYMKELPLSDDH
jgi:hypothetical protein